MDERLQDFITDYLERAAEDPENLPLAELERILGDLGTGRGVITNFSSVTHRAATLGARLVRAAKQDPAALLAKLPALRRALGEGGGKALDLDAEAGALADSLARLAGQLIDEAESGAFKARVLADPDGSQLESIELRLLLLEVEDWLDAMAKERESVA